jgi:hypothetical protein
MTRRKGPTVPIVNIEMANLATLEGYAGEVYKVAAVMLHPNDKVERSSFVMSATVDLVERIVADITPSPRVLVNKPREVEIRSPERLVREAMAQRLHRKGEKGGPDDAPFSGPSVAAAILARAFKMAHAGHPEIGIMQVIAEQGEAYRAQRVVGAGRDRLTEIWTEYRSVAHIAAAFMSIKGRSLQDRRTFFDWIGKAADILKEAGQLGSRFAEPILPQEECWRIVLTPTALGRGVTGISSDSVLSTPRPPWSQ